MADRSAERRWLGQLTGIPTAPGHEQRVMDWVRGWAGRRHDLRLVQDEHGNLLITQKGRKRADPVVAVAHTDHPGFVVTAVDRREVAVDFRGGVRPDYFPNARLELFDSADRPHRGKLTHFDAEASRGQAVLDRSASLQPGDIGRWSFGSYRGGVGERFAHAPACDDLAGVAAALAALDRARADSRLGHFGVLLTRAEEVGFVGAIGACRVGTLTDQTRVLSIECSRAFDDSPLGGGPVVRVGDASSVFHHDMTNRIAAAAVREGLTHQRKLMAGGSCEATAFVGYGYRAAGLCLPLGNYHNMGHLNEVEQGKGPATPLYEVISLSDFHGLVGLLLLSVPAIDEDWDLTARLDERFEEMRAVLK